MQPFDSLIQSDVCLYFSLFNTPTPGITIQSQELYKLAQFLQEALHREKMLEQKLSTLQKLVQNTQESSEGGWQVCGHWGVFLVLSCLPTVRSVCLSFCPIGSLFQTIWDYFSNFFEFLFIIWLWKRFTKGNLYTLVITNFVLHLYYVIIIYTRVWIALYW